MQKDVRTVKQSSLGSFIEVSLNVGLGFIISFLAWPLASYIFNVPTSPAQHLGIVGFFTVLSLIRGFLVRRYANHMIHNVTDSILRRFFA